MGSLLYCATHWHWRGGAIAWGAAMTWLTVTAESTEARSKIITAVAKLLRVKEDDCFDDVDWVLEQIELARQHQPLTKPVRKKVRLLRSKMQAGLAAFNALPEYLRQSIE